MIYNPDKHYKKKKEEKTCAEKKKKETEKKAIISISGIFTQEPNWRQEYFAEFSNEMNLVSSFW